MNRPVVCSLLFIFAGMLGSTSTGPPHTPSAQREQPTEQPDGEAKDEKITEASVRFFLPVTLAYLAACGGWMLLARTRWAFRPSDPFPSTNRAWIDLGFAALAAVGLFAVGLAYRSDWLIPRGSGWLHHVSWALNNLIIYAPIFIVMRLRGHGLTTVLLSTRQILSKSAAGCLLAVASTLIFLGLRGQLVRAPKIFLGVFDPDNATNILPVFLEGVALAFLFVRVRWALGLWPAVFIPAVLFAVAHIPRQMEGGSGPGTIAAFFVLNTVLPAAIMYTVFVSRDIIWIGIVHYVMDIAIGAFD